MLDVTLFCTNSEEGCEILCQILPNLRRISHIVLDTFGSSFSIFNSILEHPIVSTVLFRKYSDLPLGPLPKSLSKIMLEEIMAVFEPQEDPELVSPPFFSNLDECPNRGMKAARLQLLRPHLLDNVHVRKIDGLREVILYMGLLPVSFSWLPTFTAAHPHLEKIEFHDDNKIYFSRRTPFFLSSFVEECRRQDLDKHFCVKHIVLGRTPDSSSNVHEWRVTAMTIVSTFRSTLLIELLSIIASSFSAIRTFNLDFHGHRGSHRIEDLIMAFSRFFDLRYLYLDN
ncbi:hypothetical protein GYMLUDRAFT_97189 [Collybiopsis luxurians FD-317 M1]|uniref:Uncharacterized protein n=1 Tax=Collybiopsis luxurians FD-317 M1 TaxID=944289 RepID=A0A0D0B9V3_9AGAR|nr:hypothetical protein GYMLUDRAFT_97189 [Collybiopsis luxurians FD-317 M1]